jgi:hypothetical protein
VSLKLAQAIVTLKAALVAIRTEEDAQRPARIKRDIKRGIRDPKFPAIINMAKLLEQPIPPRDPRVIKPLRALSQRSRNQLQALLYCAVDDDFDPQTLQNHYQQISRLRGGEPQIGYLYGKLISLYGQKYLDRILEKLQ